MTVLCAQRGVLIRKAILAWTAVSLVPFLPTTALAQSELGDDIDVQSHQLTLTPDIANKAVAGRQTIRLRPVRDGVQRLSFSSNALTIDQATLNGMSLSPRAQGGVLEFDLPKPLARGRTATLELSYHGRPTRGFAGSATTLYTSYFACDWMFCLQNRFGDKADFTLDLHVPHGLSTLSLGRMARKRMLPDGSEIHSWRSPRAYSAYLYGFAVGPFVRVSDPTSSAKLTYLSDVASPDELKRRFADTPAIAAFLANKAGVALPVAEYSQLLVDGDEAQEAATYSVLGRSALPTTADDPDEVWAIVHELSHQWWGNLITCATLKDFWLNEGIATFMTAAWKEHRYGAAAYQAELDIARNNLAKARAQGFDKPLTWGGQYPSLGTRRAVQYSKGALFIVKLRETLGEDAFWSGLRRYTQTHSGGTVTSIDLQKAMEAASGRDLQSLFAEWVFGAPS